MELAIAIIALLSAIAGAIASYLAYKQSTDPRKAYEDALHEIEQMEAELRRLRADGGNGNAYAADRLRERIAQRRAALKHLAAALLDD